MSTGCSGSRFFLARADKMLIILLKANAVRYGTAKGEWFLNAVSCSFLTLLLSASGVAYICNFNLIFLLRFVIISTDSGPPLWRSH